MTSTRVAQAMVQALSCVFLCEPSRTLARQALSSSPFRCPGNRGIGWLRNLPEIPGRVGDRRDFEPEPPDSGTCALSPCVLLPPRPVSDSKRGPQLLQASPWRLPRTGAGGDPLILMEGECGCGESGMFQSRLSEAEAVYKSSPMLAAAHTLTPTHWHSVPRCPSCP